jgi:DNA recombination protein RmuC
VHQLGRELYQRLSTMGGHIDKLGRSLNNAVGDYNKTVSSLETRVFVTARRMIELQVVDPSEAIGSPTQITEHARSTQAPEVAEQRLVALPKLRVPIGQGDLLTGVEEPDHRATS